MDRIVALFKTRVLPTVKRVIGMDWVAMPVRTAFQVGIGVLAAAFLADHSSLLDGTVWKHALELAIGGFVAKFQAVVREG